VGFAGWLERETEVLMLLSRNEGICKSEVSKVRWQGC